jgi:branched-chain amino acid transport system substrate-binding protein
MILISCAAAEVIVNPVAKWVFKTPQKDSDAVKKIYGTMKDMGISKIAVLTGNTGFGNAGKGQLEAIAPEFGIEILASEVYDKKETDLSAVVAKLMANKDIQAVVNWSIVPAQGILAKNMRQAGWDVPLFQSHGFGNIKYVEAGGAAAEGIIFPAGRLLVAEDLPDSHPQGVWVKSAAPLVVMPSMPSPFWWPELKRPESSIRRRCVMPLKTCIFNFSPEDHNGLDINSFEMLTVKDGKFAIYNK